MRKTLVDISNLIYRRADRTIFNGIDIQARSGQVTAIFGPSGCGKTTLLRLIGAQLRPDDGKIVVAGETLSSMDRKTLYAFRRDTMGMLFQNNALFTNLNVFDNMAFPLRENTTLSESMIRDIVLMKLEAVGLRGAYRLMISELSGGMARRVALARAIVLDPKLIMYDEPFTGQDPIMMGILLSLIRKLTDVLGIASIVVSHDIQETLQIADYVYVLSQGKLIGVGTPTEILEASSSEAPELYQFIHGIPDGVVPFHFPAKPYDEDLLS